MTEPGIWTELAFRLSTGPKHAWNWVMDRVLDRHLDAAFGIVTSGRSASEETDHSGYQATSYRDLQALFSFLEIGTSDVLLDYGSGMGRVLCLAATFPFRTVVGIESSSALAQQARENVERVKTKLCCPVRVVTGDAENFAVPAEVTVVYLFNPFRGEILRRVLEQVNESVRQNPRALRVIYYGTVSCERFRREAALHPWLTPERELRLPTGARALLYRTKQVHSWNSAE
jgi:SAM-dependent methyltransferase